MPPRALIGIDLGTSSVEGAAFDLEGRCLARAEVPSGYRSPSDGWAEADADQWWNATCEIAARLVDAVGPAAVQGVGITGQAPTLLAVDSEGRALGPAILWLDVRSEHESRALAAALGPEAERISGNRIHPYYLGPKLEWLRCHEPERLAAASSLLQSHSYPVLQLTGARATDYSCASLCAPLYDAAARTWSAEICARLGLDRALLPDLGAAHRIAGHVTARGARATTLREGTPVVVGGADFAASTLAAGVTEPGEACLVLGSAGNLIVTLATPGRDVRLVNGHHVGCDRFLVLGATLCGAILEWFRTIAAPGVAFERLDAEAAAVPAGAEGARLLPYLSGERTPTWDADARGAFFGLSLGHGRANLYRAALEAVAVSFRHCLEVVREGGADVHELIAVDGGARSAVWRQILCDALGMDLWHLPDSHGAPGGAALLAGIGVGALDGPAAAKRWRGRLQRHVPDPARGERYAELLSERIDLYQRLRRVA